MKLFYNNNSVLAIAVKHGDVGFDQSSFFMFREKREI